MRILIISHDLSETALFDLVVQQAATSILDLRRAGDSVPQVLSAIYHRPTRVMASTALQRLLGRQAPGDNVMMILIEFDRAERLREMLLKTYPDVSIELLDAMRIN